MFTALNHRKMQVQNKRYKTTGNRGLFDEQETYQKLSAIRNPLEKIIKVIEFEIFRRLNF